MSRACSLNTVPPFRHVSRGTSRIHTIERVGFPASLFAPPLRPNPILQFRGKCNHHFQ